ncbi:HPr kinase/phosphorylase, partial [Clostridium saudiense]|nr:HPr kinase/phosphorylase [Clostridium saudiense]
MSVAVEKLIKDFDLEILVQGDENVEISVNDINRPGLQLAGFYNYFAPERLQVIGKAEWFFLDAMQTELRKKRVEKYFSFKSNCIVIT